jgi:hypothetical protein
MAFAHLHDRCGADYTNFDGGVRPHDPTDVLVAIEHVVVVI